MGKPLGSTEIKNVETLTPDQKGLINQILQTLGPDFVNTLQQQISPLGTERGEEYYKEAYLNPALETYNQETLPNIFERFSGDQGASSALNQTLARSAKDLELGLRSQYAKDQMGQQGNVMTLLSQLLTGKQFEPVAIKKEGWLGPATQAAGTAVKAAGALAGG